jgi:hypothetical protein
MPAIRDVYFAFPDGAFEYVCDGCLQSCCRIGGAIDILWSREGGKLLELYPEAASLVRGRVGPLVNLQMPLGRCHWFTDDGLCAIERDHGTALKPYVCRLFPFNDLFQAGGTLVVAPRFSCPMTLADPVAPDGPTGYRHITGILEEFGVPDWIDPSQIGGRIGPRRGFRVRDFMSRERQFRDKSTAAMGRETFWQVVRGSARNPEFVEQAVHRGADLLMIPRRGRETHDAVDRVLLALAPALRLAYPYAADDRCLVNLGLLELLVRSVLPADRVLPQSVFSFHSQCIPVLCLISAGDQLLEPTRKEQKLPFHGNPRGTFAGYRFLKDARNRPIIEALAPILNGFDLAADRLAFLFDLAHHLRHTVLGLGGAPTPLSVLPKLQKISVNKS